MTDWNPPSTAGGPTRPAPASDPRLAALAARRQQPGGRQQPGRRRHPARSARIAATGLGLTTMLGLVAAMELGSSTSAAGGEPVPDPPTAGSSHAVVVLPDPSDPGSAVAPPLVVLQARPVVQPAPAASPAPTASTHGSR